MNDLILELMVGARRLWRDMRAAEVVEWIVVVVAVVLIFVALAFAVNTTLQDMMTQFAARFADFLSQFLNLSFSPN